MIQCAFWYVWIAEYAIENRLFYPISPRQWYFAVLNESLLLFSIWKRKGSVQKVIFPSDTSQTRTATMIEHSINVFVNGNVRKISLCFSHLFCSLVFGFAPLKLQQQLLDFVIAIHIAHHRTKRSLRSREFAHTVYS